MKSKIVNTLLFWLILIVIGLNLGFQIYSNKNLYLRPFNLNLLQKTYQYSQYAANPENRKLTIQDYDLFAYSGYQYLKGTTPAELQIEHPPLAKYFFGLSILLFSNPNIIQIFFGVGVLIVVYQIGKRAIENDLLALLPLLIISFDGTFKEQLALSYLDLPHLFFISCAVLFYLMAKNGKKYYFFVSIFL